MSVCIKTLLNLQVGYLTRGMGIWDKKFFSSFLTSMMTHKTPILGKLSMNTEKKNQEKIGDKNRHFLEKESFSDFPVRIEKRCFGLVWEVSSDDCICIDEVDIAKPCAEKMEGLSKVHDGSTWAIVNGYMFHGVSIRWIPVILEHEDLGVYSKNQIWKSIINRITKYAGTNGIYLMDAYYEIASYLDVLMNKKLSFVIRARRDRIWMRRVTITESGTIKAEPRFSYEKARIEDFPPWIHSVRLPDREYDLFLHVKHYEWFNEPIRVVTNRETWTKDDEDIHACDLYFQRWEVERIFKTIKQEFKMEEIRTQSLQILKNVVAVIQLAVAISNACYNDTSTQNRFHWTSFFRVNKDFERWFERYTRRHGLTMNRNSIVSFISYSLEKYYRRPPGNPRKYIDRNPPDSAQIRLFTVNDLRKSGIKIRKLDKYILVL